MHIPDGFLDTKTILATSALSVVGISFAVRETKAKLNPSQVPLLGLTAAFIFAAQMLNFPVAAGTSGHLVGGVLAAMLLGPAGALLAITAVLMVQCLVFADGGVLALGANVFNMGIICAGGGYILYRIVAKVAIFFFAPQVAMLTAVALAAWLATVLASITCAGQLAWSGVAPWRLTFAAMAGVHALIGIGEAIITMLVVATIARSNARQFDFNRREKRDKPPRLLATALLVGAGIAVFVSPFACSWPDGLESVTAAMGIKSHSPSPLASSSLLRDYRVPGIRSAGIGTMLAGALGAIVVFTTLWLAGRVLSRRFSGDRAASQ